MAEAQRVLRAVADPETSPADAAKLVDSSDPQIGTKVHAFAQGASMGGYTPDSFSVTSVTTGAPGQATAAGSIKSPHAPAPVAMPLTYVFKDAVWKLSETSTTALLAMGSRR